MNIGVSLVFGFLRIIFFSFEVDANELRKNILLKEETLLVSYTHLRVP